MPHPERPPLRRRSTTHVSASETEWETTPPAKRTRVRSPEPAQQAPHRAPLAPLVNGTRRQGVGFKSNEERVAALEDRVKTLESELNEVKRAIRLRGAHSPLASAPSSTPSTPLSLPEPMDDAWVQQSLEQSLRELQQGDPTFYLLPQPVRQHGVTRRLGYQFNSPKQHDVYHSSEDIRKKGAPTIYCTRVNEGHHQENRDSALHVNHQDNDKQVSEIDATKEAMAKIRMTINAHDKESLEALEEIAEHGAVSVEEVRRTVNELAATGDHWRLGSPALKPVDSRIAVREAAWLDEETRRTFDQKLRGFLRDAFQDEPLRNDGEERISIRPCKCIYIHYTSAEDYTDKIDLMRCNPTFQAHAEQRFDCVNVNLTPDALEFARLLYLFRCKLPSGHEEDVALVRLFKTSRWSPKTVWENCRVLEDGRTMFILPRYFIRGAHLINAFGAPREASTFYLNDAIDCDWFIRAGN